MNFRDDSTRPKALAMFSHSSLTDIVFLLLIFFLLTSSFVVNNGIQVEIPKAESAAPSNPQLLEVVLTSEARYYLRGEEVSVNNLRTLIEQEFQRNPKLMLVLRADKSVDFQSAIDVLNVGQELNMPMMIATEKE